MEILAGLLGAVAAAAMVSAVRRRQRELAVRSGELAAGLEQEEQRYEPGGAHSLKMTEDGLFVCESLSVNLERKEEA